ncbi:hypothetical protein KAU15_02025 [candidate division WOR-3 bacterium]|nr:hypothetical protein [candidate division WOR-3 bacterium]
MDKQIKSQTNEEFRVIDNKKPDLRNRITLSNKVLSVWNEIGEYDSIEISMRDNGDVLLKPVKSIPASEAWIYQNPEVIKKIRKGLRDVKQGKMINVDDVDEFIDKL